MTCTAARLLAFGLVAPGPLRWELRSDRGHTTARARSTDGRAALKMRATRRLTVALEGDDMTRNRVLSLVAVGGSLILGACNEGNKPAPAANPPATTAAAATSASASVAAGDFGAPECDEYMKKYLACIDSKVPEAARPSMKQALDAQKSAWKQAASTPEGRSALATGCKTAAEQTKTAVQAYGCTW